MIKEILFIIALNVKEIFVLRYKGPDIGGVFGLRNGHCYYWPCDVDHPLYEGVIDDEEYTSYWYPTEPEMWEILEDPIIITDKDSIEITKSIYENNNFLIYEDLIEEVKVGKDRYGRKKS